MQNKISYKKKVFENGLTLVNISGLSTNSVTISVFLRAGFRFDPQNKPGLSHFSEHMVFRGMTSFPNPKLLPWSIEHYGGWHSAFTWIENQKHFVHLPKDKFEIGAKILLESTFKPLIERENVGRERGVINEEILRNKSDPSKAIWDYVWLPLFFQGTSLARPYSGTERDISFISESDVKSFALSYFQPKNAVVFVAGDIEDTRVLDAIMEYNKTYNNRKNDIKIPVISPMITKRVFVQVDNSYHQTTLIVGIKTVPFMSYRLKHTLDILQQMLAGYSGSPLMQDLRYKEGLVYTWNSFQDNISDTGYITFVTSTAHKNVNLVANKILLQFGRFAQGKFTTSEIKLARRHLAGSILSNTETGKDYIEWYGLQELLSPNRVLTIREKIDLYKSIAIDEIKEAASKYFRQDNVFVGAIGKTNESSLLSLF